MKISSVVILVLAELLISALIIFLLLHEVGKEKQRADGAEEQVNSAQTITANVLTTSKAGCDRQLGSYVASLTSD